MEKQNEINTVWVDPDVVGGDGTYKSPFSTIEDGLAVLHPGKTLCLKAGVYEGDCNIEVSGSPREPIRIIAAAAAEVVIKQGCWFFYDTSDLVVAGLTFLDAPFGGISVVGSCSRNRFEKIRFVNCGTRKKTACTFYFGGVGGSCNSVEACVFSRSAELCAVAVTADTASIGLMISHGMNTGVTPGKNNLIRHNSFENYGYGILVGSDELVSDHAGHIIEYNTIRYCSLEGILVKSGDVTVRGNILEHCARNAIAIESAIDTIVADNRIVHGKNGIIVRGSGHTVANNCIAACTDVAICACGSDGEGTIAAQNLFVENNTFVNCGTARPDGEPRLAGLLIDQGTTGIMQNNLIFGLGKPYAIRTRQTPITGVPAEQAIVANDTQFVIKDNGVSGGAESLDGACSVAISFASIETFDCEQDSPFGAHGWMVSPEGCFPDVATREEVEAYRVASVVVDENGTLVVPGERGPENLFGMIYGSLDDEFEQGEDDDKPDAEERHDSATEDRIFSTEYDEDEGFVNFHDHHE